METTELTFGNQSDPTETFITAAHQQFELQIFVLEIPTVAACEFDLLQAQRIGMKNGVFYLNGFWLGSDQGELDDSPVTLGEEITTVRCNFSTLNKVQVNLPEKIP